MVFIDVRGSVKPVNPKEFLVFRPWRRAEAGSNGAVNEIPEAFTAMGLKFKFRKLYVISCVYHLKCFSEINLMEISD